MNKPTNYSKTQCINVWLLAFLLTVEVEIEGDAEVILFVDI